MGHNVLDRQQFQCRVSSVSNKDVTQFGKLLMFDGKEDTCWCSDKDSPQWIKLQWANPTSVSGFQIQFQGGFVGQDCEVIMTESNKDVREPFYPEDINSLQTFHLSTPVVTKQMSFNFSFRRDRTSSLQMQMITKVNIYGNKTLIFDSTGLNLPETCFALRGHYQPLERQTFIDNAPVRMKRVSSRLKPAESKTSVLFP